MRVGVDLGGTKIEAVALADDGRVVARERVATPRDDYDATLAAIVALVRAVEQQAGIATRVGVGMPGSISPASGLVRNANSTWLNGRPFGADLARALGRPLRLENDANCFALSEATDGAGAGARTVFGVIVGTGVGGGLVVDGRLVGGASGIAGEWGHTPLPWMEDGEWPGPSCWCGLRGCIETFLSGPALARDGGSTSALALSRYERRLARALAMIINVLDPDVVVLGGGLSNLAGLYDNVPRLWSRWVFSDLVATRLLPPVHGATSGVRGAAWL